MNWPGQWWDLHLPTHHVAVLWRCIAAQQCSEVLTLSYKSDTQHSQLLICLRCENTEVNSFNTRCAFCEQLTENTGSTFYQHGWHDITWKSTSTSRNGADPQTYTRGSSTNITGNHFQHNNGCRKANAKTVQRHGRRLKWSWFERVFATTCGSFDRGILSDSRKEQNPRPVAGRQKEATKQGLITSVGQGACMFLYEVTPTLESYYCYLSYYIVN